MRRRTAIRIRSTLTSLIVPEWSPRLIFFFPSSTTRTADLRGPCSNFPSTPLESDGVDALALQAGDELRVEVAEDHLEHFHRLFVRKPTDDAGWGLDVRRLDAEPFERVVDGGRPAVDHDHVFALRHQFTDVSERSSGVDRTSASDFDNNCHRKLSSEFTVRRRGGTR